MKSKRITKRHITLTHDIVWSVAVCCATVFASEIVTQARGSTFYVDPAAGSMDGDGSASSPWRTLEEVFANHLIETRRAARMPYAPDAPLAIKNAGAPVKAGDTIVLRSGYHGEIFETGAYNLEFITIAAGKEQTPTLGSIHFRSAARWRLRGLTVNPELADEFNGKTIVHVESHNYHGPSRHFVIEDSSIYSAGDTTKWTADDWNIRAADGIVFHGSNGVFRNNRIKNIHFGIVAIGDDIVAESNVIDSYSADGMRGGGDRVTFQENTIQWAYKVDDNHDDAIQFYRPNRKACRDVVLRGNVIKSYPKPGHPLVHAAQGIGCFNGPYVDWIVENNVVMVAHYHGITLVGAQNPQVINNTVLDITGQFPSWIQLKNSTGGAVRNNLVNQVVLNGSNRVFEDHNKMLHSEELDTMFLDWQRGDLRLKPGSAAIDAGSLQLAPDIDAKGVPRPQGTLPDLGAYELVP